MRASPLVIRRGGLTLCYARIFLMVTGKSYPQAVCRSTFPLVKAAKRNREERHMSDSIRFPVGPFEYRPSTPDQREKLIKSFRQAPENLRKAVSGLSNEQLMTPYREGGWTVAQVVHHIAELDVNSYPRLKYALTEVNPPVLTAKQELWAELLDSKSPDIESSLTMFEAIRARWVEAWLTLKDSDFERKWNHPKLGLLNVDFILQQYEWHPRHHTGQITSLRSRMGW